MFSFGRNLIISMREPDLARLRGLPRAEAMRIAMIKYGWDAATAARKVDIEQGRQELADRNRRALRLGAEKSQASL